MFSDRLKLFIEHTGQSTNAFEIAIGVSKGAILKPINNKKSVGSEVLDKILSRYPQLNLEWLVTGKGEMLKSNDGTSHKSTDPINKEDYVLVNKDEFIELQRLALRKEKAEKQELQEKLDQAKNG